VSPGGEQRQAVGAPGYRERHLTSQDNLSLYYRDYGNPLSPRLPALCLPGLTRNSKDFHLLALRLSRERRVLCPDYRGRGKSDYDPDWRRYRPATYLDDLRHLLAATNCHRVVVIGTSMGGLLASGLAASLPSAVAGSVLNDVGPEINAEGIARILDYVGRDRPQPDWPTAASHLRDLLPTLGLKTDDAWLRFTQATFREGKDGQLHFDWDTNLARNFAERLEPTPDLWALFRALGRVPVAALRGANSDVLTVATFDRMRDEVPNLIRVTVPGKGHAPALDEPPALAAIDTVLEQAEAHP